MIILVEGPDGSGKTTLCNKFIEKGYNYIHLSRVDNQPIDEFYDNFINCIIQYDNVIIDRAYISNVIYQTIFKDSEIVSRDRIDYLKSIIDKIILCIPDEQKYFERFNNLKQTRDELYSDMSQIYQLYKNMVEKDNEYHFLIDNTDYVIYNMDKDNLDDFSRRF